MWDILVHSQAEYAFGAHPFPTSGVFVVEPGKAEGCFYRTTVDMGEVRLSLNQIREVLSELAGSFTGNSYDLLNRFECCPFVAHR